jgi:hypothetical protein
MIDSRPSPTEGHEPVPTGATANPPGTGGCRSGHGAATGRLLIGRYDGIRPDSSSS